MTIYSSDLESDDLLEDSTKIHCFGFKPLGKEEVFVFCNYEEMDSTKRKWFISKGVKFFKLDQAIDLLNSPKTTGLIWHNFLAFDGEMFKKFYGLDYSYESFNNRKLKIYDTLVFSRYLNPERRLPKGCPGSVKNIITGKMDRVAIHGLDAWGYKVGIKKPSVNDWRNHPLEVYVNRVIEDCKINEATYYALLKECKDIAIPNGEKLGDWSEPLKMSSKAHYLMHIQQKTGVLFDVPKATKLIIQIDKEMKEIEDKVEPDLGERYLPKNQQPQPPKQPWKKAFDYKEPWTKVGKLRKNVTDYLIKIGYTDEENQKKYISGMIKITDVAGHIIKRSHIEDLLQKHKSLLSSSAIRYCQKIGINSEDNMFSEMIRLEEKGEKPVQIKEKLRLKHKKDIKEYLINNGWVPTLWKGRNIIIDKKTKKKLSDEDIDKKYNKYIKEFHGSVYWPFIIKELGYKRDPDTSTKAFKDKCIKNGRGLLSSPQFKDQRGVRCINLKRLTGDTSRLIIRWLSLQNRRNTIESPPSKTKKKYTGWLHHPRLKIDGRLPARSSGITPTYRKRHSVVVNVPKAKDKVVLGKEMRSLFISPENYYNIGGDGVSIEAMCASHYTIPFDNGQYAEGVLSGTFHDDNAKSYSEVTGNDINRDEGKNFTYMIMYGGSGKKAAIMASVSQKKGNEIIESFWETNPGLKKVKEALEQYWKLTGNKYIFGLDGRKVFTRSRHSLMNTLFQHAGALILDFAQCYVYDKIKQYQLDVQRWGEFHDEAQAYEHKNEIEIFTFNKKPEQERDGRLYSKAKILRGDLILHDKTEELSTDRWIQYYAPFGHYLDEGFKVASKYFKTNVEFRSEYIVGKNWSQCH